MCAYLLLNYRCIDFPGISSRVKPDVSVVLNHAGYRAEYVFLAEVRYSSCASLQLNVHTRAHLLYARVGRVHLMLASAARLHASALKGHGDRAEAPHFCHS